jgi:hypothetical protein
MCTGETLMPTRIAVDDDGDICHNPADLGDLGCVIDTAEGVRHRARQGRCGSCPKPFALTTLLESRERALRQADLGERARRKWHSHWVGSHNGLLV